MSYCRFSSNNFKCDVYVYESASGFTVHVASRRYKLPIIPSLPYWTTKYTPTLWAWSNRLHSWWVRHSTLVPIGLPNDGKTFNLRSPVECAVTLIDLQEEGYRVPNYAIKALLEEK